MTFARACVTIVDRIDRDARAARPGPRPTFLRSNIPAEMAAIARAVLLCLGLHVNACAADYYYPQMIHLSLTGKAGARPGSTGRTRRLSNSGTWSPKA